MVDIQDENTQIEVVKTATFDEVIVKDICQELLGGKQWKVLAKMVKNIDQEPESVRRGILGYLTAVMLNSDGGKAESLAKILLEFEKNYYDSGKSGLAISCYMASRT